MRVEDADDVVAHHVDHVDVGQPGSQLPDHLAPVVGQHGVQLALVVTQRGVPGEDVVSVGIVKDWGGGGGQGGRRKGGERHTLQNQEQ